MRKLASIQVITKVEPIDGADKIELVHVLGWQCVAEKGEFNAGDLCVYFEVDSFLPVCDEFEMLRKSSYRENEFMGKGFKLRTMKFKGHLSQGLVLNPAKLPQLAGMTLYAGLNVTDELGVVLWEVPEVVSNSGTIRQGRPSYIPKTDETRVQSSPELLKAFSGLSYYITTKMDGSSHSVGYDADGISYTTHNCTIIDDGKSAFVEYIKSKGIASYIRDYAVESNIKTLVVQGEWCGEGIQKNRLKLKTPEWFVFTVIIDGERVGLEKTKEVCRVIGAQMVPIEETGKDLPQKYPTIQALLERSVGIGFNDTQREGIVIRPVEPVYSDIISAPLSMKVLNNKYLLKNED